MYLSLSEDILLLRQICDNPKPVRWGGKERERSQVRLEARRTAIRTGMRQFNFDKEHPWD